MTVVATEYDVRLGVSELLRGEKFEQLHRDFAHLRLLREDDRRVPRKQRVQRPRLITVQHAAREQDLELTILVTGTERSETCLLDVIIESADVAVVPQLPAPNELSFVLYIGQGSAKDPQKRRPELRDGRLQASFWVAPDMLRDVHLELEWSDESDVS